MIQETPVEFIVHTNHQYPPYNTIIFEDFFCQYMIRNNIQTERIYLPILWTNFYLSRGNGDGYMQDLQIFLDSLDRTKKYFTVLQYDDGILQDLKDLDILVFCSGGGGSKNVPEKNLGYPIPLLCQPSPYINLNKSRDIKCNFVGVISGRHKIREEIRNNFLGMSEWIISEKLPYSSYEDIMEKSVFTLCPRGYGATSFRICESLQYGSIPVYIYDKPWIPWKKEFDFNEIGILVSADKIKDLKNIIDSKNQNDIDLYRKRGKEIYDEYFDYDGCAKQIIIKINDR